MPVRQVRHLPSQRLLVTRLEIAETRAQRLRGLLGRDSLPDGEGLLLPGAWSIHTFGMAFPIDILFLSRTLGVRKALAALPPRRIAGCFLCAYCLELPAGTLARVPVAPGDRLAVEELS